LEFRTFPISGLIEITPTVFQDPRGYFFESFHQVRFESAGIHEQFVQDNQSFSKKGVLRGLHFQKEPYAQGKLVRVFSGRVYDVALDIRPDSPTFGQHQSLILDAEKNNLLYIPPGFAHGFLALEDSVFMYKCTQYYNKESEWGIAWNDPELGIDWGLENPLVSEKDMQLPNFKTVLATLKP
jgi:dTDP-4-dehydrorhamnose 3,5-epimerase